MVTPIAMRQQAGSHSPALVTVLPLAEAAGGPARSSLLDGAHAAVDARVAAAAPPPPIETPAAARPGWASQPAAGAVNRSRSRTTYPASTRASTRASVGRANAGRAAPEMLDMPAPPPTAVRSARNM